MVDLKRSSAYFFAMRPANGPGGHVMSEPSSHIFLMHEGEQVGPYGIDRINEMLSRGEVAAGVMAWRPGMADWMPLSSIPGVTLTPPLSPQTQARIAVPEQAMCRSQIARKVGMRIGIVVVLLATLGAIALLVLLFFPKVFGR